MDYHTEARKVDLAYRLGSTTGYIEQASGPYNANVRHSAAARKNV